MLFKKINLFILLVVSLQLFSCKEEENDYSLIPVAVGEKWGYINNVGEFVINPQFSSAKVFSNGLALVQESSEKGLWGFIDKQGLFVIKPTYKFATIFKDGYAWVTPELSYPQLIDTNGEIIVELKNANLVYPFSEGLAAFRNEKDLFGFVSTSGKVVINPQFSYVGKFSDGLCAVGDKNGNVGFINKNGELVINYQFKNTEIDFRNENWFYLDFKFTNGECPVLGQNNKYGIINKDSKYLVNPQYDFILNNNNGAYTIYNNSKTGWIDINNKTIINPQFESISTFNNENLAPVTFSDSKYGYIDNKGKMIITPQFDEAGPFLGEIAAIRSGDKFGFINKEGIFVINPQYDGIAEQFQSVLLNEADDYVLSDFVDCSGIIKLINTAKSFSLMNDRLNDDMGILLKKYKLDIDTIPFMDLRNDEIKLINGKTISNNFYIDYYAKFLKIWEPKNTNMNVYGGWEMKAASKEKPIGLTLIINLTNIAVDKEEAIINTLTKALPYKVDNRSTRLNKIYNIDNDKVLIVRKNNYNTILISILNNKYLNQDIYYYNYENQNQNGSSSHQENIQIDSTLGLPDTLYRR